MKRLVLVLISIGLLFVSISNIEAQDSHGDLYRVGIGDMIIITVLGHENLSGSKLLAIDGTIAFPHLGTIYIKDKTLVEIEREIADRLGDGYIKYPVVSVSLGKSVSKKIFIHGQTRSGSIAYEKDLTVLKALSLIGGIGGDESQYGSVKIRRKPEGALAYEEIAKSRLIKGLIKDVKVEDMLLQPEDIVLIERSDSLFVRGQVATSGRLVLEDGMTVSRALTLAGGITEEGLHGKVKLRRKKEGSTGYYDVIETDLDDGNLEDENVEDMILLPDDVLIVERSDSFFVRGQIAKSGRLVLEDGMTVSRALTLAGGITEEGLHGKMKIRRKKEGSTGYYDVIEVNIDDGNLTDSNVEDMLLQPDDILKVSRNETYFIQGEIMLPSKFLLEYGMTVGRAITVAGGVSEGGLYGKIRVRRKKVEEPGYNDIEIDIEDIIEGKEKSDILLQPDDIIIVDRNKTYIIYGEVNRIGEFPITNDTTVFKAILRAGGFNKWGSESRVKVLRPIEDGKGFTTIKVRINDVIDGDNSADIFLKTGDIIIVSSGLF